MNFIPENLRSQLAPGWSGVNIALVVILMIVMMPLGLLMIAYILFGESLGLDLGRPETFTSAFERIGRAINAGVAEFNGQGTAPTNSQAETPQTGAAPATTQTDQAMREAQNLQAERDGLAAERRRFEAEKAAFYQRRDQG